MKSRISNSVYGLALAFVLALAGAAFLSPARGVSATAPGGPGQSDSEAKKLEGTWRVVVTPRFCDSGEEIPGRSFRALITFARGETLNATSTASLPNARLSNEYGVWRHEGDHTYSAVSESFVFSSTGAWLGTHRLTRTIEIGDDPDTFSQTASGTFRDTDGDNPILGLPAAVCSTAVGHRLEE